jgi:TolB-like protein
LRRAGFRLILILLCLIAFGRCAKQVSVGPAVDPTVYGHLAVLPFETESIFSTVGNQIADEIVLELIEKAPEFHVIERARIDALLLERNLDGEGISARESALEAARLLGVDAIITGSVALSISDLETAPERQERRAEGVAVVRLISVSDGRVIWAKRIEGDSSMLTHLYDDVYNDQTDHTLIQDVVQEIAYRAARCFYPHTERR